MTIPKWYPWQDRVDLYYSDEEFPKHPYAMDIPEDMMKYARSLPYCDRIKNGLLAPEEIAINDVYDEGVKDGIAQATRAAKTKGWFLLTRTGRILWVLWLLFGSVTCILSVGQIIYRWVP